MKWTKLVKADKVNENEIQFQAKDNSDVIKYLEIQWRHKIVFEKQNTKTHIWNLHTDNDGETWKYNYDVKYETALDDNYYNHSLIISDTKNDNVLLKKDVKIHQ